MKLFWGLEVLFVLLNNFNEYLHLMALHLHQKLLPFHCVLQGITFFWNFEKLLFESGFKLFRKCMLPEAVLTKSLQNDEFKTHTHCRDPMW